MSPSMDLPIAWVGWRGPVMREWSRGVERLYPGEVAYYVIGNHDPYSTTYVCDFVPDTGTPPDRTMYVVTPEGVEELWEALSRKREIFYDSYIFSVGHRPEITNLLPGKETLLEDPRWQELHALKILVDGESGAGQLGWYREVRPRFDRIFTTNGELGKTSPCLGINVEDWEDEGYPRTIPVSFTGGNLDREYRAAIAAAVRSVPGGVVAQGADRGTYLGILQTSRFYVATYSCASGSRDPMMLKDKIAKAVACGSCPLTETYEDEQFAGARLTFSTPAQISEIVARTTEETRRAIVAEARKRIKTWHQVWEEWMEREV